MNAVAFDNLFFIFIPAVVLTLFLSETELLFSLHLSATLHLHIALTSYHNFCRSYTEYYFYLTFLFELDFRTECG